MRASLLILAVALSGFVQAAHVGKKPGKCEEWKEQHSEEHSHEKDGPPSAHDVAHTHNMKPDCDEDGNFMAKQCHEFEKEDEWCDEMSGLCFHFLSGDKWCACFDPWDGTLDPHTITKGGYGLHCGDEPEPEPEPCPEGWTFFTEHDHAHCYMFVNDNKTWAEAESYCQFKGPNCNGHLASIHCEETDLFISKLAHENYKIYTSWAGAFNVIDPTFWLWSDGIHFDYDNFFKEANKHRNSSCLRVNFGLNQEWSPGCCNERLPFVCQTEVQDWQDNHHH